MPSTPLKASIPAYEKYTLNKKVFTYDDTAFKSIYLSAQSNRKNEGKHVLNGDTDLQSIVYLFS